MKVLLIKDVYKLGRAGDIKRVADGYGRNFLLPQGLAVLATQGAIKQIDQIRTRAVSRRAVLNEEMGSVAEVLNKVIIGFPSKAGENGKLYGSITTQMIADAIFNKAGIKIERQKIDSQPIRNLGDFKARIRLTVDLIPEVKILVYREGETPAALVIEKKAEETPA
jgi:large subunit ribosomal protein L9